MGTAMEKDREHSGYRLPSFLMFWMHMDKNLSLSPIWIAEMHRTLKVSK